MKWNGTVSQREKTTIATRLASEKTTHAMSTQANGHWDMRRSRGEGRLAGRCGQCSAGGRCGQCKVPGQRGIAGHRRVAGKRRVAGQRRRRPGTASRGKPVALTAHRLNQVETELGTQPP